MSPRPANPRGLRASGLALVVAGLAFLTIGLSNGRSSFLGLGPALATIGIVLLAQAKRKG